MSIEDRIRQASENILHNSSLGADLMDDEAQTLLDWGLDHAARLASRTQALDDLQATFRIDESLVTLRRTMRRVGKLIGNLKAMDSETAEKRLTKILETADQLPGVRIEAPEDVNTELDTLRGLPSGEALQRVLSWVAIGGEGDMDGKKA